MSELKTKDEKSVAVQQQVQTVGDLLQSDAFQVRLRDSLPALGMDGNRFANLIMSEVKRTPKLAQCTVPSLAGAVLMCAQLGLEPGPMGLSWIIPRNNRRKNCMEANFQLGYRGAVQLAWRSAQIASVQTGMVHERDEFDYAAGVPIVFRHKAAEGSRGEWTHTYAVLSTTTGGHIIKVMTREEIYEVRDRYSEAWKFQGAKSPWGTNEDEMAMKTVLLRAMKLAPISTELQMAVSLDDRSSQGIEQEIDVTPPEGGEWLPPEDESEFPPGDPALHVDEGE